MKRQSKFPPGWDEARVRRLLEHYESQSDEQAVAEDEAAFESTTHTAMQVPVELVPAVRHLIASRRTDINFYRVEIADPDGDTWMAEQLLGVTISGMGQPPQSHVRFINRRTGQQLDGHALGGHAASIEELRAALAEAKRQHGIAGQSA